MANLTPNLNSQKRHRTHPIGLPEHVVIWLFVIGFNMIFNSYGELEPLWIVVVPTVVASTIAVVNTVAYDGRGSKMLVFLGYLVGEMALGFCAWFLSFVLFILLFWVD